jgi:hypothetical protein
MGRSQVVEALQDELQLELVETVSEPEGPLSEADLARYGIKRLRDLRQKIQTLSLEISECILDGIKECQTASEEARELVAELKA